MSLYIGSDHRGFSLKEQLRDWASDQDQLLVDCGAFSLDEMDDYADFAKNVCDRVLSEEDGRGLLLCDSGVGMGIAANRFAGIRAAVCDDVRTVKIAREHNDLNILCVAAQNANVDHVVALLAAFLETDFSGAPRHVRRIGKLDNLQEL